MNALSKLNTCILLLTTSMLFLPLVSQAQDIYYSKEEKFNFQNGDYAVVGQTGDFLYTYTATGKGYFLNAYNDSMALKAKVALDFFPAKIAGARIINYPENMVVLYQAEERNYIIQYVALLDNRGLLVQQPKAIDSVRSSWFSGSQRFFKAKISADKSKIMIYGMGKKSISTTLLDAQLNLLHHEEHGLNSIGKADINQALLDNNGRFYFTATEEAGNKKYSNTFRLYQLDAKGKQLSHKALPGQSYYYSGMLSKINVSNGLIYSAGFYSDKKNGNLLGVTYFDYNPETRNFSSPKNIAFSNELKNDTQARNKKKAFNDAMVRELIVKNDGGFLIVAEDAYTSTRTEMAPGWGYYSWYYSPVYPDRTIREYIYGDIILLNFDPSGNLSWHQFIRKDQYSQEDNGLFSSYAFLNSGASLVFLFNNFNARNNKLELVATDGNGQSQRQILNTGNIGNADWLPRKAVQVAKTTWIVPILNRNNLFFAKVAF